MEGDRNLLDLILYCSIYIRTLQAISGPRIPVEYRVSLTQISTLHQQVTEAVAQTVDIYSRYITLTIDNGSIVLPNNLYVMSSTASNPAGEAIIIHNSKFSKLKLILL